MRRLPQPLRHSGLHVFECKLKTRRSHCVIVLERPHVGDQVDIAARGDMAVYINVGNCEAIGPLSRVWEGGRFSLPLSPAYLRSTDDIGVLRIWV